MLSIVDNTTIKPEQIMKILNIMENIYFVSSILCVLFLPYKISFLNSIIKKYFYNCMINIVSKQLLYRPCEQAINSKPQCKYKL